MSEAGTSGQRPYVASLTGLRGIAAFWVFLFHFPPLHPADRAALASTGAGQSLQTVMDMGFAGVYLFFVLSGFLLAQPFASAALQGRHRPALRRYFKRRVLRVFPAYWAQLIIILAAGAWFVTWRELSPGELLGHALMFLNIGPQPVEAMVSVWWTLPVEFSFYLLLPLVAVFMRAGRWWLLMLAGLAINLAYLAWASGHFGDSVYRSFLAVVQLPGTLMFFLLGSTAAMLSVRIQRGKIARPSAGAADVLFLAGAAGSFLWLTQAILPNITEFYIGHWTLFAHPLVLGVLFSAMVMGLFSGSRTGGWLCANPVVYFTGLVSYSLYLWHFPVVQQVQVIGGDTYAALPGPSRFVICLAAVMLVSTASYLLFERPFFRLRGKRTRNAADASKP
jgi:peptidoglycan/LPS O-acetylase OafA/YrhL